MTLAKPLVIGGWLADMEGAGYYRMKLPLDELARRGHSVEYRGTLIWRRGKRPSTHVLVAQRISNEGPTREWQAAAGDVRRVLEIDDDLLNVDPASTHVRSFYGPDSRARLLANIRAADVVTVSTPFLAEVVHAEYGYGRRIHVLPNCLDPAVLDLPPVDQTGPVTVGWAGSDTHRGDFEHVRKPLRKWFARRPHVAFQTMGVPYGYLVDRPGPAKPWVSIWEHGPGAYMRELDWQIGIAPLANTQFNRCKSALKALEYAARGIVIVASDVEPYRRFVRHGETGFLVGRDHEWAEALDALAGDEQLRVKMAAAAREQAAEWTIDQHAHLWEQAYRGED